LLTHCVGLLPAFIDSEPVKHMSMKPTKPLLIAVVSLFVSSAQAADDDFSPKVFVEEHCTRCHDASVYTRPNHSVNDVAALKVQVQRCHTMVGETLFEEEIDEVVNYLNETHYKFKE